MYERQGTSVGAGGEDVVATEVVARESEVLSAQGVDRLLGRAEMACDRAVKTDGAARGAEVSAEGPDGGVELLEHAVWVSTSQICSAMHTTVRH